MLTDLLKELPPFVPILRWLKDLDERESLDIIPPEFREGVMALRSLFLAIQSELGDLRALEILQAWRRASKREAEIISELCQEAKLIRAEWRRAVYLIRSDSRKMFDPLFLLYKLNATIVILQKPDETEVLLRTSRSINSQRAAALLNRHDVTRSWRIVSPMGVASSKCALEPHQIALILLRSLYRVG